MAQFSKRKQAHISKKIAKLVREYKATGKLTTSRATYRPRSIRHAQAIAAAIEYSRARRGR